MTRATYRAWKCRQGVHRPLMVSPRSIGYCKDCRRWISEAHKRQAHGENYQWGMVTGRLSGQRSNIIENPRDRGDDGWKHVNPATGVRY